MGFSVSATCKCGYSETVLVGRGFIEDVCLFPALCGKCGRLVEVNFLAKPVRCPKCRSNDAKPYNSPSLVANSGAEEIVCLEAGDHPRARHLVLTNGNYFCPSCGRHELTFTEAEQIWD